MTAEPLTLEALQEELQKAAEEMRRQRFARFEATSLAWLALVPAWTDTLAERCGFPSKPFARLEDWVAAAAASGVCARAVSPGTDGQMAGQFWLQDRVRGDVLAKIRDAKGSESLEQEAFEIRKHLQTVKETIPPALEYWIEVVGWVEWDHYSAKDLLLRICQGIIYPFAGSRGAMV